MTTIEGRITDTYGRSIPEVAIVVDKTTVGHHDIAQMSDEDGNYKLLPIVAGSLTLLFNATDYAKKEVSIFLEKGEHRRLDIVLHKN